MKRLCKSMLKDENYNEAIAYCAMRITKCTYIEEAEAEYERIDEILWNIAENCDDDKYDYCKNALRIISAIPMMISAFRKG